MKSVAEASFAKELGVFLAKAIPLKADKSASYRVWTDAVYESLKDFNKQFGWTIYPQEKCYAGEYLCDFTLHERGYGCRIACESQWQHWKGAHQGALDWAFDKLRGVKSDVKLFIFEGTQDEWQNVIRAYLENYDQLSTREAYVALRWQRDRFVTSWWTPEHNGKQTSPIQFEVFAGFGAPSEYVLDVYGNNAAVKCPACGEVFIVSAFLNGKQGRACPHCARSVGTVNNGNYEVAILSAATATVPDSTPHPSKSVQDSAC